MFNWDKAPKWAKWVAMDESGNYYWYQIKPKLNGWGEWDSNGKFKLVKIGDVDYDKSLEARP